jgi:hypothetical protein
VPAQVIKGCYTDLLLFTPVHGFQGTAEVSCSACFDFDKDDAIPILADNINFTAFLPIISGNDFETSGCKKINGTIFALFTETDSIGRQTPLLL